MIRLATSTDCPALAAIANSAYAQYVERIGRRPPPMDADFLSLVAAGEVTVDETDSAIRGYVVWRAEPDHVYIENLAVDPVYTGQGIGRRLLEWVERQAFDTGQLELRLCTNVKMIENLRLYAHFGWIETGRRCEDGLDRVYLRKTAAPRE